MGDVADGLDVVDDGRFGVEALDGREWRLDARVTTIAFQAGKLGSLFAALIGAGPAMNDNVQVLAAAEDIFAQIALGFGFLDGFY